MKKLSSGYSLAEHIHSSFRADNRNLTPQEITDSGVTAGLSYIHETPRITAFAEDLSFRENLSLARDGIYYFSHVEGREGGSVKIHAIPEGATYETQDALMESLFMNALIKIAVNRHRLQRKGMYGQEGIPDDFAEELDPELREFAWRFSEQWGGMPEEWRWVQAQNIIRSLSPEAQEKIRLRHPELYDE